MDFAKSALAHKHSLLKSFWHIPLEAVAGQNDGDRKNNWDDDGDHSQHLIWRPILPWSEQERLPGKAFRRFSTFLHIVLHIILCIAVVC